jgi:hypothetical protein
MFGHKIDFIYMLVPEARVSIPEMNTYIVIIDWFFRSSVTVGFKFLYRGSSLFQISVRLALLCDKVLVLS